MTKRKTESISDKCTSKMVMICSCGKKIEHAHYSFHDDKDVVLGRTGHGQPMTMPKKRTAKNFKK